METPAVWCLQLSNQQDNTLQQNAVCKPTDKHVINSLKHSKLQYNTEGEGGGDPEKVVRPATCNCLTLIMLLDRLSCDRSSRYSANRDCDIVTN